MPGTKALVDARIYLLADHLDTALAIGEDLLAQRLPPPKDWPSATGAGGGATDVKAPFPRDPLAAFVARLDHLEAALLARILQARRRISDMPRLDASTRTLLRLFVSNTELLSDVIARFGETSAAHAEGTGDPYVFLRSRALLADNAASIPDVEALTVGEAYRVAAVLELGSLLDLVSSVLDMLDASYDLYSDDRPNSAEFGDETEASIALSDETAAPVVKDSALTPKTLADALAAIEPPR